MKTKHTQTPWSYIISANGGKLIHIETDMSNPSGAGTHICSLPSSKEENAAFIVRAVNAHEELLEAAKDAQGVLHEEFCDESCNHTCINLQKAIAKAEAK